MKHPDKITASTIRVCVATRDYSAAREAVLHAAREGRAQLLPAWARDNRTARVLVDGEDVGQASTLCHYVREAPSVEGRMFGTRRLLPERNIFLPDRLKG